MNQANLDETMITLERAVLERRCKGDPFGFVDHAADDVTDFDHVSQARVDGIAALKSHVHRFVGQVDVPTP